MVLFQVDTLPFTGFLIIIVILVLVIVFLFINIFRRTRETQTLHEQIIATNRGLEMVVDVRTKKLRQASKAISESIDYASLLQRNLLPTLHLLDEQIGEVAVIWQPKDVVGGDYYWSGQIGTKQVLVAMDCTGHGVSGALMTMIAHSALEQIQSHQDALVNKGKPEPIATRILHLLHDSVYRLLHQSKFNHKLNGIDAGVIVMADDRQELEFAGAHMDMFSISPDGLAQRHKGDKFSLGYGSTVLPSLQNHKFDIDPGHIFALTTDGLLSQPGSEKAIGFGYQRFVNTLNQTKATSPASIAKCIMRQLGEWQGPETRRDNVLLIMFQPRPYS